MADGSWKVFLCLCDVHGTVGFVVARDLEEAHQVFAEEDGEDPCDPEVEPLPHLKPDSSITGPSCFRFSPETEPLGAGLEIQQGTPSTWIAAMSVRASYPRPREQPPESEGDHSSD